jgi:hypothetical protein
MRKIVGLMKMSDWKQSGRDEILILNREKERASAQAGADSQAYRARANNKQQQAFGNKQGKARKTPRAPSPASV